ncbi:hypothetical protein PsorP6_009540 [Peronosclerospora sorghi]|uniref:Uncharacterized protein n=1 Tax=Peronosclerospora sorghi TaxID=230839 RepID=A0ACC0W000_9STRA|nr:hypothetical protein PsorP6_009540 [Peronosclerospora sorghi]
MADQIDAETASPPRDEELKDFGVSSSDEETEEVDPSLDEAMLNELLLVCSNLGMLRVQHEGEAPVLMRGEDCEKWVHDLQRVIRRDHAKHRLVAKQLGRWKIVQKKLLPLLVNHQYDWPLVFSLLKVLVMLTTKPPHDSTKIAQQIKYLRQYKAEFLRCEVVTIMMTILVDPLSKKGSVRTSQDYLKIEIVLMLFRNLLAIPNEDPRYVTSTTAHFSRLQEDFIYVLHEENVYDMILLFAQDIDSPENREWNLLIMEMLDITLDCSQPKAVAAYAKKLLAGSNFQSSCQRVPQTLSSRANVSTRSGKGDLFEKLKCEKEASALHQRGSRRHSNFGGVLTMTGPSGRNTVFSDFSKTVYDQVPQAAKKPTPRKSGKKNAAPITDINEVFGRKGRVNEDDERTMRVLHDICESVIAKSYFQLTNSLKTEFRRGSSKLISTDRLQYFHLVWFLTTYHRLKIQAIKSHYKLQLKADQTQMTELQSAMDSTTPPPSTPQKPNYNEQAVLSTLDMFSFNFVLQSIENYATMKNYHGMTVSVQLLAEMMAYLAELTASDDPRFQRIADSLQHKIFYERDFLDRLPVLLKTWSPGVFSKAYVVDVITLIHRQKKRKDEKSKDDEESDGSSTDEEETERQARLLMEMQRKEAEFDVRRYFSSMVSADTIRMYCSLLADYRENSVKVNHYIHSFFYRTKHFKIYEREPWTLQPMLFNIHVLLVFNKMLHDAYIQRLPEYKSFLDFIRGVVRDFFALADTNHLLLVEVFLRQSYPAKSCMLMQRNYQPIDSMGKSKSEAVAVGRTRRLDAINESRRHRIALDHEELEGEAEVQFTLEPSDFGSTSLVDKDETGDAEGEASLHAEQSVSDSTDATSKPKEKTPMSRAATERAKNWSRVEDRYLAKVFLKYRHLPSVYEVISYEDMFQERDRTPEQIERRVKYLRLHRMTLDSSDVDEDEQSKDESDGESNRMERASKLGMDGAADKKARPKRRLRRGAELSDSSDDDILLRGPTSTRVESTSAASGREPLGDVSTAVQDAEMKLTEEASHAVSPNANNDASGRQHHDEDTHGRENNMESEPFSIAQPDRNKEAMTSVLGETSETDVANTYVPDKMTAQLQATTINDNDVPNSESATQLLKRLRTAEDDEVEGTPVKKINCEAVVPSAEAS